MRGRSRGGGRRSQSVCSREESAAAAGQWIVSVTTPNGHRGRFPHIGTPGKVEDTEARRVPVSKRLNPREYLPFVSERGAAGRKEGRKRRSAAAADRQPQQGLPSARLWGSNRPVTRYNTDGTVRPSCLCVLPGFSRRETLN